MYSAYAHAESMSIGMVMSPSPPSNRWWERFGGECTCHGVRWTTLEPRGRRGPGGAFRFITLYRIRDGVHGAQRRGWNSA
jgi:hypothetical protein